MTRGFAVVQTLLVIASAIACGWYATTKSMHFPLALREQFWVCETGYTLPQPSLDAFWDSEYSSALRAAREPSLYLASLDAEAVPVEVVRFTWLRSFHNPVVVRIDASADGTMRMTATETYNGALVDGRGYRRVSRVLSADEAVALRSLLETDRLAQAAPIGCEEGLDGAQWLIERSGRGHYDLWRRWSPDSGPVHEVGLMMLKLTGWSVEPVY